MHNDEKVKPLHIILPKTRAYIQSYDRQTIWDKVSADIKNEFDSEPAYNKNFFENQNKIS